MMRTPGPLLAPILLTLAAGLTAAAEPAAGPDEIHPLLIGSRLPELTLQTEDGSSVELNKIVASKPTILIFYRGGW